MSTSRIYKRSYKYAGEIAKAQLISLMSFKNKYPNMEKEELYVKALTTRRKITNEIVENFISICKEHSSTELRFLEVVHLLVLYEFKFFIKGDITSEIHQAFNDGVCSVIPIDL